MKWLDIWEKSGGHHWKGERGERNVGIHDTGVYVCGVCGKVCRSKGGLVVHRRRLHEVSSKKKEFVCEACKESFRQEANLLNHRKVCGGREASEKTRRLCECGREFAKTYIARHRRKCLAAVAHVQQENRRLPRVYKGKRVVCDCGVEMAATNKARHQREACPVR